MSIRFCTLHALPILFALIVLTAALAPPAARAAEAISPVIVIEHQQFKPAHLVLPSGQKVKLTIRNRDSLPAEFESYDMSREIIVPAGGEVTVYVGPLDAGTYGFFNDFNHAMKGQVVAKPTRGH